MLKRLFDISFSVIGLILLSPILLLISVLVKMSSKGEIFYKGKRVGKNSKPINVYKFRSMVQNADKIGSSSTSNSDKRMTGIGKILRKYKLDELPQLFNVLKGEMSFVGPRPEVEEFIRMFTEKEKCILSVRPGITDWASLWNSDEGSVLALYPDPDKAYMEIIRPIKIQLQLLYINNNSIITDVKIILFTFYRIMNSKYIPAELKNYPRLLKN